MEVGGIAHMVKHWVGDADDRGMNPVIALTFSCAAIHFPTVYNLHFQVTASPKVISSHVMPILCLHKCRPRLSSSHLMHHSTKILFI